MDSKDQAKNTGLRTPDSGRNISASGSQNPAFGPQILESRPLAGTKDEQQALDLAFFKEARSQMQDSAFSRMREILRWKDDMLKASGYKTREDAIVGAYKYSQERIDKLLAAFLKKYPD